MLKRLWPETNHLAGLLETEISDKDHDVVSYVGGSLPQKLRKNASADYLECLKLLGCSADKAAHASWTAAQDRGGLTYLPQESFAMFEKAASIFKTLHNYCSNKKIWIHLTVHWRYQRGFVYIAGSGPENITQKVLRDIGHKYYKIRIHHRGKALMQKLNKTKQKGLRKSLKTNWMLSCSARKKI